MKRRKWDAKTTAAKAFEVEQQTQQDAMTGIFKYLEEFSNRQRQHSTLGYLSPLEFERQTDRVIEDVQ